MKKKMSPHIIAAGAFVVFIVLGLASGAMTMPSITLPSSSEMVKTYEMQIMPNTGILQGKGAVVFDLAMAEKILPKYAEGTSGGGGLVGAAIGAAGNAADLKNFINAATNSTWVEQENNAVSKKQPKLYEAFSKRYGELSGVNTVRSSFNFNNVTPTVDYFSKANTEIKSKIAAVCAEKKVDFAVTMVGQIVYAETMNAAPISVPTTIIVEVCLFDKSGTLVSQGKVETVSYSTKGTGHINVLNVLLDDAIENIVLMLPALGGNGNKTGTKEYVAPTIGLDKGDTRDAGPNETVLTVQRIDNFDGWPTTLILNKGTDNERYIPINAKGVVRVIIQNGENIMEAQVTVTGPNEKNDPITFTATGGQITYTLSVKGTVGAGNLKTNERFTWTKK
jgi:hypothetical protein